MEIVPWGTLVRPNAFGVADGAGRVHRVVLKNSVHASSAAVSRTAFFQREQGACRTP